MAIDLIDHLGDLAFGQKTIDQTERDVLAAWQDFRQKHAARSGHDYSCNRLALLVDRIVTRLNPRVQRDRVCRECMFDFANIAKTLCTTSENIAEGALTIAIEHMANAIKQVSIFCGHDSRRVVLIAFGGAG